MGGRPLQLDVSDPASIERAAAAVRDDPGALDVLVNNAGIGSDFGIAGAEPDFDAIQRAQQTEAVRAQTAAQLQRDNAGLIAAQKKVAVLATEREQAQAQLARSQAAAQQAELNLSYTTIVAPVAGQVGARTLRALTHLDVSTAQCLRAADLLAECIDAPVA